MNYLDYSLAKIQLISTHYIENKFNQGTIKLGKQPIQISAEERIKTYMSTLFLSHFNQAETHCFSSPSENLNLNPMFQITSELFQDPTRFHQITISLAKHLFNASDHPKIKPGELFVAYVTDIAWGDEMIDALSLIKVENKTPFMQWDGREFMQFIEGISIEKVDKGCLVINSQADEGFRLRIIDQRNKSQEAQFWKDKFLQVQPVMDEYQYTQGYLQLTKNFIETELAEQIDVPRSDQLKMMNRSYGYFKTKDEFNVEEFTQEVFSDINTIRKYGAYIDEQSKISGQELTDHFEISTPAVKKQARAYRSVIKLDRNFHIYVHGDESKIEKGKDPDGQKYYKLYFTEES